MSKTREDYQLEIPTSLRDIVTDELYASSYPPGEDDKQPKPITDDLIQDLLLRVYQHIEKEALATYHSNQPWALRQWALNNILKEEVVGEVQNRIAHELIAPVVDWQGESYDPVAKYREKLIADGKPSHSVTVCLMPVIRFVARKGRKSRYTDDDIIEHISYLRQEGYIKKEIDRETGNPIWKRVKYKPTTLYNEVGRLKQFFQFLNGRNWFMPVAMPEVPDREEMYQPMLSNEDIEQIIFTSIIDCIPASWVVRLAASTIYGLRLSELSDFQITMDGDNSSIYIRTRKKGIKKHQPIPKSLVPIFALGTEPMKEWKLQYILNSVCKKAQVKLPKRAGWHAIRRAVVTNIYHNTEAKEIPIINYFRWSTKQRHLSQLPTYVKSKTEETDMQILSQHPFVPIWQDIIPYLVEWHPEYSNSPRVRQLYNEMI